MYVGWTQVAFVSELEDGRGGRRRRRWAHAHCGSNLALLRVFDGTCPHRGAHLGFGGRLDADAVICPFHGHRVSLGEDAGGRFQVHGYRTVQAAKGLFVLFEPDHDTGLAGYLDELGTTHHLVEAFAMPLSVPPEYVIENVLDEDHFATVHALDRRPRLTAHLDGTGTLLVEGEFDMVRANQWQSETEPDGPVTTRFSARVFSPTVVVSELGPVDQPMVVITSATPSSDGGCVARVTVALPRDRESGPATVRELASLVSGSKLAFEQDSVVWNHLDTRVTPDYTGGDQLIVDYRSFCAAFAEPANSAEPAS